MDDKLLIAEFAANEMLRINERIKDMLQSKDQPTEELRESVINDIETTLGRLQNALSHIMENTDADNKEETKQ